MILKEILALIPCFHDGFYITATLLPVSFSVRCSSPSTLWCSLWGSASTCILSSSLRSVASSSIDIQTHTPAHGRTSPTPVHQTLQSNVQQGILAMVSFRWIWGPIRGIFPGFSMRLKQLKTMKCFSLVTLIKTPGKEWIFVYFCIQVCETAVHLLDLELQKRCWVWGGNLTIRTSDSAFTSCTKAGSCAGHCSSEGTFQAVGHQKAIS